MRFAKRVFDRGVLTVPQDVREALEIDQGDLVEFEVLRVMRKAPTISTPATLTP